MPSQSHARMRAWTFFVLLALTAALFGYSCEGSDDTKLTCPEETTDLQRYEILRPMLIEALTVCRGASDDAFEACDDVDTTIIPGLDWPVVIPDLTPERVYWTSSGMGMLADHSDNLLRVSSTWSLVLTVAPMRSQRTYYREESDEVVLAESWRVHVGAQINDPEADTTGIRLDFSASQAISGMCSGRSYCQRYGMRVDADIAGGIGDGQSTFLPGGDVHGEFEETATSATFNSDMKVHWHLEGSLIADGLVDMQVTSGLFAVRDTLPFGSQR